VPPVGTARDGLPCPTTRDFLTVDQDQSDNVSTTYLATADGRTAQDNATNRFPAATTLTNPSDNRLLDSFIAPALGCQPFMAPDLTNGGKMTTSLALNELQAAAHQTAPVALIPLNNPMTLVDGQQSVAKTNAYRFGVNMPRFVGAAQIDDPNAYCNSIMTTGQNRLNADQGFFENFASPDPAAAANLFDFMQDRLTASLTELQCPNQ
jgi:hypothetical protein